LGVEIINTINPTSPTKLSAIAGSTNGVAVAGDYVYLTGTGNFTDGFRVIDINDATAPVQVASVSHLRSTVYVADKEAGLRILDFSDAASPFEYYDTSVLALDVDLAGSYAYVPDGIAGLRVINISDSSNPNEAGFYDTPGTALGVVVDGSYAYVADGKAGLRIINIDDTSSPFEASFVETPGTAYQLVVRGNYVYVANGEAGLLIIDVLDPAQPQVIVFTEPVSRLRSGPPRSILHRLGDMSRPNHICPGQVGDSAGELQHTMEAARREV
jgi:hypothetical protein